MRGHSLSRLLRERPGESDRVLASVLFVVAELELLLAGRVSPATFTVAAVMTVALGWRRRAPLATVGVVMAAFALHLIVVGRAPPGLGDAPNSVALGLAFLMAVYSVGAHARPPRAILGAVAAAAAGILPQVAGESGSDATGILAAELSSVVVPFLLGALVQRTRRARELRQLARQSEEERDRRAHEAVALERSRIARELHDIVAHSVSLIVVQAEAGEALLDREPGRSREAFRSIQTAGRQALVELRKLLGVLRTSDAEAELSPQPGLADIEALVRRMTDAGMVITLQLDATARPVSPGVQLAAYRVVQEALTNVLKHSAGARTSVSVHINGELHLEVVDDGPERSRPGDGHGLAGMRERVQLYGGTFQAGPLPRRGYGVRASIPIE